MVVHFLSFFTLPNGVFFSFSPLQTVFRVWHMPFYLKEVGLVGGISNLDHIATEIETLGIKLMKLRLQGLN